ncbi:MAG: Secretion system C-terminal sorting domain [Bacteroidetes bacterium]|jgi:hypothetical protein|nr:Secretion system C-terminal sorting domain [Bacteroidota bacterium]
MKKIFTILFVCLFTLTFNIVIYAQNHAAVWDSIKNATMLVVEPAFQNEFGNPYRQPLADYGWEDGLQISPDGLNLYALYSPSDLLSWQMYFVSHLSSPFCDLVGNMSYLRSYSQTYGMDLVTNPFGCDSFSNIDILYSHRTSITDNFTNWQLSGIARGGIIEGSPAPLFSETDPNLLDLFMFTGNNDIWQIKNTTRNPSGINSAVRLPSPINPVTNEFNADNAFLTRINSDSIILIYEKYTDPDLRDFTYTISDDTGSTWSNPVTITTINNSIGHIEHPCLYKDGSGQWWLYFSIDYTYIARAKQLITGNWDSWDTPQMIISKGNSPSIGEPTVTANGDISFSVSYMNTVINDTNDVYDLDPWILPKTVTANIHESEQLKFIAVSPNPFSESTVLKVNKHLNNANLHVFNSEGKLVRSMNGISGETMTFHCENLPNGLYFIMIIENDQIITSRKVIISK